MDNDDFLKNLLAKYLNGDCTPAESRKLFKLINQPGYEEFWDPVLIPLWKSVSDKQKISRHRARYIISKITNKKGYKSATFIRPYQIVATISILLLLAVFIYNSISEFSRITISSGNGEVKTVILPDSSIIILNANSSISYWKNWNTREVRFQGEAYFEIKKNNDLPNFIVAMDHMSIKVLGTTFNVKNRRNQANISLNSGKIQLQLERNSSDVLEMLPGEMVDIKSHQSKSEIRKFKFDPTQNSSWKDKKLVFDNTSLGDLSSSIEDIFGLRIYFENEGLADLKFKGTVPYDNLEILWYSLEKAFELKIIKSDKRLIISHNKIKP